MINTDDLIIWRLKYPEIRLYEYIIYRPSYGNKFFSTDFLEEVFESTRYTPLPRDIPEIYKVFYSGPDFNTLEGFQEEHPELFI